MQKITEKQHLETMAYHLEAIETAAHNLTHEGHSFVLEDRLAGIIGANEYQFTERGEFYSC